MRTFAQSVLCASAASVKGSGVPWTCAVRWAATVSADCCCGDVEMVVEGEGEMRTLTMTMSLLDDVMPKRRYASAI